MNHRTFSRRLTKTANRSVLAFVVFVTSMDAVWWWLFDALYWIDLIMLAILAFVIPSGCRRRDEFYIITGWCCLFAIVLWFVLEMNLYLLDEHRRGNIPASEAPQVASLIFIASKLAWCLANVVLCFRAGRRCPRSTEGLCPACSYDLIGNESGTCPECGKSVDSGGEPAIE